MKQKPGIITFITVLFVILGIICFFLFVAHIKAINTVYNQDYHSSEYELSKRIEVYSVIFFGVLSVMWFVGIGVVHYFANSIVALQNKNYMDEEKAKANEVKDEALAEAMSPAKESEIEVKYSFNLAKAKRALDFKQYKDILQFEKYYNELDSINYFKDLPTLLPALLEEYKSKKKQAFILHIQEAMYNLDKKIRYIEFSHGTYALFKEIEAFQKENSDKFSEDEMKKFLDQVTKMKDSKDAQFEQEYQNLKKQYENINPLDEVSIVLLQSNLKKLEGYKDVDSIYESLKKNENEKNYIDATLKYSNLNINSSDIDIQNALKAFLAIKNYKDSSQYIDRIKSLQKEKALSQLKES